MLSMSDAGDLRDSSCFWQWVVGLPELEKRVLGQAAFEYIDGDDTIRMVFTHDMQEVLKQPGVLDGLIELFSAFYDGHRRKWLEQPSEGNEMGVPRNVVMPRVSVQVAPARLRTH